MANMFLKALVQQQCLVGLPALVLNICPRDGAEQKDWRELAAFLSGAADDRRS